MDFAQAPSTPLISKPFKFCKVADFTDWQNPDFQATADLLHLPEKSRKTWEFIHVYNGLNNLNLLNGETRGIGLGVGHECLIYAFTNVCREIVATDLYNSDHWSTASMSVHEVYDRNPFPYQRDRLVVQHMDMTQIEYPDASFDFVWSCCSIEHVSSFADLHRVYAEIHRILKPGGIAALTTEFNPTNCHSYEPHMLFTDRHWIEQWFTGTNPLIQGFDLLDAIDVAIAPVPENEPQPRREQHNPIQTLSKDVILNSIAFFLRKTGTFSQSYRDDWLTDAWRLYLAACDHQKREQWVESEQLFNQLLQDAALDIRLRIAASRHLVALLIKQDRNELAKAICQQVLPACQTAEDEDHLLPLAHFCRRLGLLEAAQSLYQTVEQLPGSHVNQVVRSIICQSNYFEQRGNYQQALATVERAYPYIHSTSTDEAHKVYFHVGFYHERLGQLEEAIAHYRKAIDHSQTGTKFQENCILRLNICLNRQTKPDSSTWLTSVKGFLKQWKRGG